MKAYKATKSANRYKSLQYDPNIEENEKQKTISCKDSTESFTEELMAKYRNYCAEVIQKAFRNHKAKRFHGLFIRRRQLRKALLIGWKTRRIISCKKFSIFKTNVLNTIKALSLEVEEEKRELKLVLKNYVKTLIEALNALYIAGTWVDKCTYMNYTRRDIPNIVNLKELNRNENTLSAIPEIMEEDKEYNNTEELTHNNPGINSINEENKMKYDDIKLPVINPNPQLRYGPNSINHLVDNTDVTKLNSTKDDTFTEPNTISKMEYLKRTSKRVEAKEVIWNQVESKVDCWKSETPRKPKTRIRIAVVYKNTH